MLSQNQTGTLSDEELGNATVTLTDMFAGDTLFDEPLSNLEIYQLVVGGAKVSTPREKKPKTFWSDVPEDVKQELTSDSWLDN